MVDWENIQAVIDSKVRKLREEIDQWRGEMFNEIEKAKQDEMMNEFRKLNARLSKIEEMLEPKDADDD